MTVTKNDLIGSWLLVDWTDVDDAGRELHPFTPRPVGQLLYTEDGRVAVVMMRPGRSSLGTSTFARAPAEARARAANGFNAYSGRWELVGQDVRHHVEAALNPDEVGTTLARRVEREGDRLTLTTPPVQLDGSTRRGILTWCRVS